MDRKEYEVQGFLDKTPRGWGFYFYKSQNEPRKNPTSRNRFSSVISNLRRGNKIQGLKLAKTPGGGVFIFASLA